MKAFEQGFGEYVCEGDTIQGKLNGYDLTARIVCDSCASIDDDDVHNVDRFVTGCNEEQQRKLLEARKKYAAGEWFYCGIIISARFYCGIIISASYNNVPIEDHAASLWSIECNYPESDNSYLLDVANELAHDAIIVAKAIHIALLEKLNA